MRLEKMKRSIHLVVFFSISVFVLAVANTPNAHAASQTVFATATPGPINHYDSACSPPIGSLSNVNPISNVITISPPVRDCFTGTASAMGLAGAIDTTQQATLEIDSTSMLSGIYRFYVRITDTDQDNGFGTVFNCDFSSSTICQVNTPVPSMTIHPTDKIIYTVDVFPPTGVISFDMGIGGTGFTIPFVSTATLCAPGTFSATGNTPCDPAPPGSFVGSPGSTSPTLCPAGTYCVNPGMSTPLSCPVGNFCGIGTITPIPVGDDKHDDNQRNDKDEHHTHGHHTPDSHTHEHDNKIHHGKGLE